MKKLYLILFGALMCAATTGLKAQVPISIELPTTAGGTGYTYNVEGTGSSQLRVLTITTPGNYIISGNGDNNTVIRVTAANANITLNGLTLAPTVSGASGSNLSAFAISETSAVKLTLAENSDNKLTSPQGYAGLHVPTGAKLEIYGEGAGSRLGKLTATSASLSSNSLGGGAGIGGNGGTGVGGGSGTIIIYSGYITAKGGGSAGTNNGGGGAGIGAGGGYSDGGGSFGPILIYGGEIYAYGGHAEGNNSGGGAGIGGGGGGNNSGGGSSSQVFIGEDVSYIESIGGNGGGNGGDGGAGIGGGGGATDGRGGEPGVVVIMLDDPEKMNIKGGKNSNKNTDPYAPDIGAGGGSVNYIKIESEPNTVTIVTYGKISGSLTFRVSSSLSPISYQWIYSDGMVSNDMNGETAKDLKIPENLTVGNHFFTCVASVPVSIIDKSTKTSKTVQVIVLSVPTLIVTPTTITFPSLPAGYSYPPASQQVSVQNPLSAVGNLTLEFLTITGNSDDFTISDLSVSSIAPGQEATFSVQPKNALPVGNHSITIPIKGTNGSGESTTEQIAVNFKVLQTYTVAFRVDGTTPAGTLSAKVNDDTPTSDTPILEVVEGSTIVFTANPNSGYRAEWTVVHGGNTVASPSLTEDGNVCTIENLSGDVDVTVRFVEKVFITVTLHANGGLFEDSEEEYEVTVEKGTPILSGAIPVVTRGTDVLTGWYTEMDCKTLWNFKTPVSTDGLILYAGWAENKTGQYAVTFVYNDGITASITEYVANNNTTAIAKPVNPSRINFVFTGWFTVDGFMWDFAAPVKGNMTLYAGWAENKTGQYAVTFVYNDGITAPKTEYVTNNNTSKVPKPVNPARTNFVFTGWFTVDGSLWDFASPVTGNMTLYAGWVENKTGQYAVTFVYNDGITAPKTEYVANNNTSKVTKPDNPARTNFVFTGWFTVDGFLWDFASPVTGNMTLYGGWAPKGNTGEFVVIFVGNGGALENGADHKIEYITGKIDPAKTPAFTRANHELKGWFKESTCVTPWDFETPVTIDGLFLYAKWESLKPEFTVTLNVTPDASGTVTGGGDYLEGTKINIEAIANSGFKFVKWTDGSVVISTDESFEYTVTKTVTLTAHFEPENAVTITYLEFDDYAVIKWNNTFMLNLKALAADKIAVNKCEWYKKSTAGQTDEKLGEGVTFSIDTKGNKKLEPGFYYFKLSETLYSKDKEINNQGKSASIFAYPNPVQSGDQLSIEGVDEGTPLQVFNQAGMCVLITIATGNPVTLSLNVPAGLYVIRTQNGEIKVIVNN